MRTMPALFRLALSLCLLAAPAAFADEVKGTVKGVDEAAHTIKFSREGESKDEVLPVHDSVKLEGVKPDTRVQLTVEGGVVKALKPERKRSAAGY